MRGNTHCPPGNPRNFGPPNGCDMGVMKALLVDFATHAPIPDRPGTSYYLVYPNHRPTRFFYIKIDVNHYYTRPYTM